ncbi:MAG: leucine-rich repeat protein [Faecousia sp.]
MKQKLVSWLVLAALLIGLLPQGALFANANSETDVAYPVDGGNIYFDKLTGTVTGCDDSVTAAVIPEQIEGVTVTALGMGAFGSYDGDNLTLKRVVLPETVTDLGTETFRYCAALEEVNIPAGVTEIGYECFNRCLSLTSIVLPEGLKRIDNDAFNQCESLQEILIPEGVELIGGEAFFGCTAISALHIPSSVTEIGNVAFYETGYYNNESNWSGNALYLDGWLLDVKESEQTELQIAEGTKHIADNVCFGHTALQSVSFPEGLETVGTSAFYECGNVKSIVFPESLKKLGNHVFNACDRWIEVYFMGDAPEIGIGAFYSCVSDIPWKFAISDDMTMFYIEGKAGWTWPRWNGYPTATWDGVNVPEPPQDEIIYPVEGGSLYFRRSTGEIYDCDESVTAADIPAEIEGVAVRSISDEAFAECAGLTSVTIPESVTRIGARAFSGCGSLTAITIPSGVTSIGASAFFNCGNLSIITVLNPMCYIEWGYATLGYFETTVVHGYLNSTAQSYAEEYGNPFTTHEFADGVCTICGVTPLVYQGSCGENLTWSMDMDTGVLTFTGTGAMDEYACIPPWDSYNCFVTQVVMPEGLTSIGSWAFENCVNLTEIDIPSTVTAIDEGAFWNCNRLEALTLPDGLEMIGPQVFSQCTRLADMVLPTGVTSIGDAAFYGCSSLTEITIPDGVTSIGDYTFANCEHLTSVTMPESVTSIGYSAFTNCFSLTNATIPNNVTSIGDSAFSHCYNLRSVTIPNGVTRIGQEAFLWCVGLTSVTIMDGVQSIGDSAFADCIGLTGVLLPESLTTIEVCAFYDCRSLTRMTIPENVTSIERSAFFGCSDLKAVCFMGAAPELGEAAFMTYNASTGIYEIIPDLVLYYIEGKSGWTSPTWNGYPTATWDGESIQHVHSYEESVVAPTCTEQGYTAHTCKICGDRYTDTYVDALGHDYDAWVQTKAPTCTETGQEERICLRCLVYDIREIPAKGHTEVIDNAVAATCTETGKTEGKHCADCGAVFTAQEITPALGHDFGVWTQTKAPTCTEKGEEKRTCSRCSEAETREIAAKGHTVAIDAAVEAACTAAGKTEGKHCSVCNAVLLAQEVIPALGHAYENGICVRCGKEDPNAQPVEFVDAPKTAWYAGAVTYAVRNGLMNGVGDGKFDPEGAMTRAMLVTVLWRYEGAPMEGSNIFSDVPNGQWYTDAVAWAAANGIVGGVGNGRFDPEGNITREQMATILHRYAEKKGLDTSKRDDLGGFPDGEKVQSWAKDAMQWVVAEGIINGSEGKLLPQGNATRAQVATILMRFIENIVKVQQPAQG